MNVEKAIEGRTITVRGNASVSVRPDYVNVFMNVVTCDLDYAVCMDLAAKAIASLKSALAGVDVAPDDLRTEKFDVDTKYEWIEDGHGRSKRKVFKGYVVTHDLKLAFDFDRERLSAILAALAQSDVAPEFKVRFTVKDPSAVKDELFAKAAANARSIAEALCRGAGARLGEVVRIDYNWQEIDVYKRDYSFLCAGCADEESPHAPDLTPGDVDVSDSATFVWTLA